MKADLSQLITNQLNSGVIIIDLERTIVFCNRFIESHSDKVSADVQGMNIYDVFSELPKRWFERKIESVVLLDSPSFTSWEQRQYLFELNHSRPITTNSQFMAQNCTLFPLKNNGVVEQICILIEDVTDVCHYQQLLSKSMAQLEQNSRLDGLTQIYNRKHWEECMAREFSRAKRYDTQLALLMFDLDNFKLTNDKFGHQGGDAVLIEVSKAITLLLRQCDIFGRYGGEEFSIILPETNQQGALEVAERIRTTVEQLKITSGEHQITASISMGVAIRLPVHQRYEDLINTTDQALYQAKSSGRNQVCQSLVVEESCSL